MDLTEDQWNVACQRGRCVQKTPDLRRQIWHFEFSTTAISCFNHRSFRLASFLYWAEIGDLGQEIRPGAGYERGRGYNNHYGEPESVPVSLQMGEIGQ